jgi:hypothetical protein
LDETSLDKIDNFGQISELFVMPIESMHDRPLNPHAGRIYEQPQCHCYPALRIDNTELERPENGNMRIPKLQQRFCVTAWGNLHAQQKGGGLYEK